MTLHLLRGFVQWHRDNGREQIKTIDAAEDWVRYIAGRGFDRFYTWTSRRPKRAAELEGGSVYFVGGPKRNQALFRMPIVELEEQDGGWAIVMRPEIVRVYQHHVGKVRGWRYLKDEDAPPDLPAVEVVDVDMPPEMKAELREAGLL